MSVSALAAADAVAPLAPLEGLRFLWLELTNRCNLSCVHWPGTGGQAEP